jgi:hypothetical protein
LLIYINKFDPGQKRKQKLKLLSNLTKSANDEEEEKRGGKVDVALGRKKLEK